MRDDTAPTKAVGSGHGSIVAGFLDAHVHITLIDPTPLLANGIARVLDLGGPPAAVAATAGPNIPDVAYAGQFLAAPGGYPTDRPWAAPGSVRHVTSSDDAAAAVRSQADAGATVIKVTLNSEAGPVFTGEVLRAIVRAAHERGLPVVGHAEGPGQAERAFAAGVDALAHTPFSQSLDSGLIAAMASRMTWISTLDIHRGTAQAGLAQHNLRRFHATGGRVLYGTDLGNGPLPVGLNAREVEAMLGAGMTGRDVLLALTAPGVLLAGEPGSGAPTAAAELSGHGPSEDRKSGRPSPPDRVTFIPGELPPLDESRDASRPRPTDAGDEPGSYSPFTRWLCSARAVTRAELAGIADATELTEVIP